jgi:PhzF family phenazine biosynthesis protein
MPQPIIVVDAFTREPFRGNPAAVCVMNAPREERWMQAVAQEMNLSETAFLHPEGEGYRLRWFTPKAEVELCGHATLASAHVLWSEGHLAPASSARFLTRSGRLAAEKKGEWIELDFPSEPALAAEVPAGLLEALNVAPRYLGRNRFDCLVEVDSEEIVRGLKPNFHVLAGITMRGVIVTSRASSAEYDFVSRFFAPAFGVDEDPVTGSAHCCLAPYWATRLDKKEMTGYQASPRGGIVRVRLGNGRVYLRGQAVTVLRGELA